MTEETKKNKAIKSAESVSTRAVPTDKKPEEKPKKSGGFFSFFKSKNKKGSGNKKTSETKKTKNQLTEEEMQMLFENFDPKVDKKKLTTTVRKQIIEAEKLYNEGVVFVKDLVAPSSMEVKKKGIKLNNMHVRSFYVFNYPRFLETNWMNDLINLDVTMDLSMFIYPTNSGRMMRVLRKKVAEMLSSKHINQQKGLVSDVSLETALEDAETLRRDLQKGSERFFQVGLYFTLYSETEENLNIVAKQLETILGGQLVMSRPADFQAERALNTTLPQGIDELEIFRNMNTGPLSTMFPFASNNLTSNEGILYGLNRHNKSLIIFDRFKLENANSVIFAKSGAGKSYAVKLEILRSLMQETDVIILDPEKEYETLTHTIGGSYINISLTSKHRINPFDLPKPLEGGDDTTQSLLRENIITLSGLLNLMLGKLNPEEDAIIDRALMQAYELKGITADIENPSEFEMPTMLDLHSILLSMEGGKNLAIRLEKYTHGTYSGLFAGQTNVDLNSNLVCFCIRDLEEQLRPISMYMLLHYVWGRVRSELKRRMLVIDEAWNIVQHEDSGRFLHNLVKRARKYYLGISTITQDVEDFMDSPWGKPIITNSSMQILLKQAPAAIEKLSKTFNLTKQEEYILLNAAVGQGLFFAGNKHVAVEIISSFGEHKIVTTNPEDILKEEKGLPSKSE